MKSIKSALLFGFYIFVTRIFFDTIFASIATLLLAIFFTYLYFKKVETNYLREGFLLGLTWFAMILIVPFFSGMNIISSLFGMNIIFLIVPSFYGYCVHTKKSPTVMKFRNKVLLSIGVAISSSIIFLLTGYHLLAPKGDYSGGDGWIGVSVFFVLFALPIFVVSSTIVSFFLVNVVDKIYTDRIWNSLLSKLVTFLALIISVTVICVLIVVLSIFIYRYI